MSFDNYTVLEDKLLSIDDEVYIPTKQELQEAEQDMEQYGLYLLWVSLKCTGPRSDEEQEILKEIKKSVNSWIALIDEEEAEPKLLSLTDKEFDTLTDILEKIPCQIPFMPSRMQLEEMKSDLDHYGLFLLWVACQDHQPENMEEKEKLGEINSILSNLIEITD